MNASATTYPSRVDWWVVVILAAPPLVCVGFGVFFTAFSGWLAALVVIFGLSLGILTARLTFPCRYVLTDHTLVIQCGWDEDRIPLSRIRDAIPSRNLLAAPVLSLRRIKIHLDQGFLLISPQDREGFITDLNRRKSSALPPS